MSRPAPRPDANRLTFDDTLFETMRRVLGVPVVSQTVWRFDTALEEAAVRRFHAALGRGPLNRRLRRSPLPAARDRWVRGDGSTPLVTGGPVHDVMAWVDEHARARLDPVHGPTWALAYAPTAAGGSLLSFVTSHVVADGSLKLLALEAAATGASLPVLPADGAPDDREQTAEPTWRDDLGDALRQLGGAARALSRVASRPTRPGGPSSPREPVRSRADDEEAWAPPVVVLDVPATAWTGRAEEDGGSANALLIAACAELAAAAGRVAPGETLRVASPVSTRAAGDLRSNASTGVSVPVTLDDEARVASLADVRARARDAYAALAARGVADDPLAVARALLPLLPGALIRRLAPSWPAPLALASNLGELSSTLIAPTGTAATSVLNRSITPPTTRGAARRTRAGLSAWWGTAGASATLCVAGADPDAFPDVTTLRRHVEGVLARHGLAARAW